ncbi:MAG: hypothetical protein CBC47_04355 [Alphaproteobacteria bacterium TMED87]|nr:RNA methyltransferase [Rhodospirillaceae bacterium]OUV09864.1 MAG: hypothetical protein CBC47_04355 [Alphaproteobacteria bacterium TMED87]
MKSHTLDNNKSLNSYLSPSVILVMPQLSENIGMVARAMLNCGLDDLRLVSPKDNWLSDKALSTSGHATSLLYSATIFDNIEDSISDLNFVGATTSRPRDMVKMVQSPRSFAKELLSRIHLSKKSGIVFGREKSGLTNEEISFCDVIVEVNLNSEYPSLNLAQAVLIFGYEFFQITNSSQVDFIPSRGSDCANKNQLINLFKHLEYELDHSGFFGSEEMRPVIINAIRSIIQRSSLSQKEIQILHGIVTELRYGGREDQNKKNDWSISNRSK